jgi:hypothetical protein
MIDLDVELLRNGNEVQFYLDGNFVTLLTKNAGFDSGVIIPSYEDACSPFGGDWRATPTHYSEFNSTGNVGDPTAHFPDEIWYIDRKAVETNTHIQFELSAAHDIQGIKLPSRSIVANSCPWIYKGSECGYTGDIVTSASGAILIPTVVGGVVTSISIEHPGYLFTTIPTIVLSVGYGGGGGAAATVTIDGGSLTSVTLTDGGSGYGKCSDVRYTTQETCEAAYTVELGTNIYEVWDDTVAPIITTTGGGITVIEDMYWDSEGNPAAKHNDVCGKTFKDCELRFPERGSSSPFGGFPGSGLLGS